MRRLVLATIVCAASGLSRCFTVLPSAQQVAKAAELPGQPPAALFSEGFEDSRLLERGWYDGNRFTISAKEPFAGKGCIEYRWKAGTTTPASSSGIRHLFEPTDAVYLRFYIRLSKGWGWTGRPYHPHLMHFMTTENDKFRGPASSHLTVYIEPCSGKLRLGATDMQNADASHGLTQGPLRGGYNGRLYDSQEVLFNDDRWHCVEAMFQLNTLDLKADKPNSDGVVRGWFDGKLVVDRRDVVLRSPDFPKMKFNQFLLTPYFGPGLLPHEQALWVDELAVGTKRLGPSEAGASEPATARFQPDGPGWSAHDQGCGGPAGGDWTYALGGEASWSNYRLDCRLALVKPAERRDGMELGAFAAFANHAHLGGYETGLILRYQSPQKFYRVAVSSLWKEVIVWRPSGGVVQAVDFPFESGKTYHLIAECRGPRIVVQVDGKPLIDWWDTADPIESGKAGLARKEGESYFAAVKIDPLEAPVGSSPAHSPRFRERAWHNLRFFFDNNEPVFTLKDDNYLDLMKLRPVSGWVKTRNAQGEGPAIGFRRFDNRNAFEFHATGNRITLYCDGKLVETLAAELKPGNWGPLAMDDGQGVHRRLSFFGSGPGDALMLASDEIPPTGGGFQGRIARLTVYRLPVFAIETKDTETRWTRPPEACMKVSWLVLSCSLAMAVTGGIRAAESGKTTFVRGLSGDPTGGFRQPWHTHLGMVPLLGIRQQKDCRQIEWTSAPLPASLAGAAVTFVWSGAMGMGPSSRGNFSIEVGGHTIADFDAVTESTDFPCHAEGCRFLYQVLFTYNPLDSSGHFFLTVPKQWLKPGEPAVLRVTGKDAGLATWFALIRADDAPLAVPGRAWKPFVKVERTTPGTPPPAGTEASYEWYLKQYEDPGVFTPIGPPADPAETAVSTHGELMYANERLIAGTAYVANALVFGLYDGGRVVPIGSDAPAHQVLAEGYLPVVTTRWRYRGLDVHQTAFARPLRGPGYTTGLESTLAWAVFDITNRTAAPREITFLAAECGDEKQPKRELICRDGVVLESGSARLSARPAEGFALEFKPVFPENAQFRSAKPLDVLRQGGLLNVLTMRGRLAPGQTVRLVVNRVFDFPGTNHWNADPPKVAPEELTVRSAEKDLAAAQSAWRGLSRGVRRFVTPDSTLNRIVDKAMLDGYFLTKRWNGRYIVFDSVCYRCQWDDASTKWFYALDLMGDHATSGRLLDTVFARQGRRKPAGTRTRAGCFSDVTNTTGDGSAASWTSCNGWALWAMAEHARLSDDRGWLAAHKKAILDGCEWILRERQFSKEKPNDPCAGLIYGKFVCDMPDQGGVSGVGYFTYTDAVSYMGLHEMAQLLADWGHAEGATLLGEAERYRHDIVAAVDRLTDKSRDPWYVPWVLHAPKHEDPYFNGVCGPINLAYGGVLSRDDLRIRHVIRWNIDRTYKGSPETSATANMFYSQDLACVLLEQGRVEDFLRMFYSILASNVSQETLTTCEWRSNTQPHVHSISSLVRMFRTMLIEERDGSLVLLQGVPRRWLEPGRQIQITEAPTWYGPLSLQGSCGAADGSVQIRLKVPPRLGTVPVRLRLRLPEGKRIGEVTVNGRPHRDLDGEWITLRGLQDQVELRTGVVAK